MLEVQSTLPPPKLVRRWFLLLLMKLHLTRRTISHSYDRGCAGYLALEVEATEAQGHKEGEGSSSTLGKEDNKCINTNNEDQLVNVPYQQIEV